MRLEFDVATRLTPDDVYGQFRSPAGIAGEIDRTPATESTIVAELEDEDLVSAIGFGPRAGRWPPPASRS